MRTRDVLAGPALLAWSVYSKLWWSPPGFRVAVFHDVAAHNTEALAATVDDLISGPGILTPGDAARWALSGVPPMDPPSGHHPVVLSFDDGFVSNHRIAADVLEPRGIKALFFINPGLVDLPEAAQRTALANNTLDGAVEPSHLPPDLRLMTWREIGDLADAGHEIGCHGLTHLRLSQLSGSALEHEILGAADLLAERVGRETDWYAYAFGDIDSITQSALRIIGRRFPICRSGVRGLNTSETPSTAILAEEVNLATSPSHRLLAAQGGLDFRYRAQVKRLQDLT